MHKTVRSFAARVTILALLIYLLPLSALAADSGARLEGLIIDVDGRAAEGATVYLIREDGETEAQATASEGGVYSLTDVPSGEYAMGIQTAEGVVAPVAGPPVRLTGGQLARRDLKLVQADEATIDQALTPNYGFGSWFGSLSGLQKTGVIVGFVAFAVLLYEIIDDDDDDDEPVASPFVIG